MDHEKIENQFHKDEKYRFMKINPHLRFKQTENAHLHLMKKV